MMMILRASKIMLNQQRKMVTWGLARVGGVRIMSIESKRVKSTGNLEHHFKNVTQVAFVSPMEMRSRAYSGNGIGKPRLAWSQSETE